MFSIRPTLGMASVIALTLLGCSRGPDTLSPFDEVTVDVRPLGNGSGRVVSSIPAVDIACVITNGVRASTGCTTSFSDIGQGGVFTLAAVAEAGSEFVSWTGCTSQSGNVCTLAFEVAESPTFIVTANFRRRVGVDALYGVNLLQNPGFESPIEVGPLPSSVNAWRGDDAASAIPPLGIAPRAGFRVLRFNRTGPATASATGESSQQWQLVDVASIAEDIDAGRVRATATCWFASVPGDAETDRRFDLRVGAFAGAARDFPAAYVAPQDVRLADPTTSVLTGTSGAWVRAEVTFLLPRGTRYLAVEIYAFENVVNDAVDPEFDGHLADDASLTLRRS